MNALKKFFTAFLIVNFIFNAPNLTSAEDEPPSENSTQNENSVPNENPTPNNETNSVEVKEFSAEGEYRLGDDDTRASAKIKALDDAKRKIAEQVGVYVQSYSEMNKSNLDKDLIRTAAAAMIKVKTEQVEYSENGTLCKVFITAEAETDSKYIEEILKKIEPKPKPDPDQHLLELVGIYEHNTHYYKVYDESMNWYEASNRCKEIGGHLVTITSKEEQAAIQSILLYSGKKKNYYWTAGFSVEEGNWSWATREEFSYTNWAKGEPNNDLGNEFIISIYNSGEWNDCPADGVNHIPDVDFFKLENAGFICEWDSFNDIKT